MNVYFYNKIYKIIIHVNISIKDRLERSRSSKKDFYLKSQKNERNDKSQLLLLQKAELIYTHASFLLNNKLKNFILSLIEKFSTRR